MRSTGLVTGACVVALTLATGCASPVQRANEACASAVTTVARLPEVHDGDSYAQILPTLTTQVTAAEQAQAALVPIGADDPGVHDRLLPAFADLVAAARDLQDAVARPNRSVRYPDMPGNLALRYLDLYGSRTGLTEKAKALRAAADAVGAHRCGTIPWRGGV